MYNFTKESISDLESGTKSAINTFKRCVLSLFDEKCFLMDYKGLQQK